MSEKAIEENLKPQDPELTPSQRKVKALCEEILALKPPEVQLTFHDVIVDTNREEVQALLRNSSFGDLLLEDGESLSASSPNERYPDLDLFIGEAEIIAVGLRAWAWEDDKRRIDPSGPTKPPYDIIDFPGEKDWIHQLDINLFYSNDTYQACQAISAYTSSMSAGSTPSLSRDVSSMAYAETGYEGHKQASRQVKDENEILEFVSFARELLMKANNE